MAANTGIVKSLTLNSNDGGVVRVTIAGSPVDISPSAQSCQSCIVATVSGSAVVYMNINAAATSSKWLLSTTPIPVPVTDLSMLHFLGASGSEVVQILYRV